jgi:DNA repair exonuclease SbcCD ATPase subunit
MKKIVVLTLFACWFSAAFSQDNLVKEIQKLTLANDSLQKQVIKPLHDSIITLHNSIITLNTDLNKRIKDFEKEKDDLNKKIKDFEKEKGDLNKKIKDLEKDIADLNKNKIKIEKDDLQKQVERLTANVAELNQKISEKDKQIAEEKQIGEQKAKEAKKTGENNVLAKIVNSYKGKPFDDLIKSSTKPSVQHDRQLVIDEEVKPVLSDLAKYFDAKELLAKKFDAAKIKDAQTQLNQIQQQSESLNKLKEYIENYQTFNDGLKESIEKIIALDKKEIVSGMDEEIQKQKFHKILAELSSYIFNYDFNFMDYPYLSDIVLDIIKRKQPNADADITDILKKLQ